MDFLPQPSSAILLLTGAAGTGKTATVHVLANELGFEVQEWINPVSTTTEGNLKEYWLALVATFSVVLPTDLLVICPCAADKVIQT